MRLANSNLRRKIRDSASLAPAQGLDFGSLQQTLPRRVGGEFQFLAENQRFGRAAPEAPLHYASTS